MKKLSIKAKITIVICTCLLAVFGTMSMLNNRAQRDTLTELCAESTNHLSWALSQQVEQIMLHGENENLQPLTQTVVAKGLLDEMTIVDAGKRIARSSDTSLIGDDSKDTLWDLLFAVRVDTIFESVQDGRHVQMSYHVLTNEEACAQCHDAATEPVLGGLKMVQSTEALEHAAGKNLATNLILSCLGLVLIAIGIVVAQTRFIFRPLTEVGGKLEQASMGDVEQTLYIKADDEIGTLMRSIQSLIDYIRGFSDVTHRLAAGDFTAHVAVRSERDVLSMSFRTMIDKLSRLIHEISDNAQHLVRAAGDISASSEKISTGFRDQTDQVTQISAAVEEMSATITEASRHADDASTAAHGAADTATSGNAIVGDTLAGMQRIASVVAGAADSIARLASSTDKIGEIIDVINDIADQTNLLALNAAIESARAGEQGRGFAVVADEVRKLAERTAGATGEVTEMIKGIQRETADAVKSISEGTDQVQRGRELADRAGDSLRQIVTMARQVTDMVAQIAAASTEQSQAARQIADSIEHISAVTKDTAGTSQESAAVAETLNKQAESLMESVSRFKVAAPDEHLPVSVR